MKLCEFTEIIENSDEVRIIKGGKDIFIGWLAMLTMHNAVYADIREDTVKKFRAIPEIKHKRWRELNLQRPLQPDETPDYSFSDLQMKLYYTIYI